MVDPSCRIQEASVAVKYAKQQKYSTFHNVDEDMSDVLQLKLHNKQNAGFSIVVLLTDWGCLRLS